MRHVLITNDFPPKIGGIQNYLYELWRRLPPENFAVLTSKSHPNTKTFDVEQPFHVERCAKWLIPTPRMVKAANKFIAEQNAQLAILDPAVPLGMIGTKLSIPYAVVLHGAEVTIPARLPIFSGRLRHVLLNAAHIISAGEYAANEARRLVGATLPPVTIVPPGVDSSRIHPPTAEDRKLARKKWNLADDEFVIIGHSRLVPRKGFDALIEAVAAVPRQKVKLLIVGKGRDQKRLERIAQRVSSPVRFLGRVSDEDLVDLLGASDVSAMLCRSRWAGLEQEGFGIVFLEAAAAGLPQIAGKSGGADEAVVDGETGIVVNRPQNLGEIVQAITKLYDDEALRAKMGQAARTRAQTTFDYDVLAAKLNEAINQLA